MIDWGRSDLAKTLGMPKEKIRFMSPYVGGGFGGKLFLRSDAVLAALGAKAAGRPVKLAHAAADDRRTTTTHRPATRSASASARRRTARSPRSRMTADRATSRRRQPETATSQTKLLYAGANRLTSMQPRGARSCPRAMRCARRARRPGLMALEIAMDEMAEKLGMDPIAFRVKNDTQVDPEKPERRFSERQLVRCLQRRARSGSAGRGATPSPARSATVAGWSAWASPPPSATT